MKILHIIGQFNAGGAETLVKDLAIELAKNQNQVEVWALVNSDDKLFERSYREELMKYGVVTRNLGKRRGKDQLKIIYNIYKNIKEYNPDIINTHLEMISFYVIIANMLIGKNIIQTIHNTVIDHPYIQKYFAKIFCKKFISISGNTSKVLINQVGISESQIKLILNGINIDKFYINNRENREEVKSLIAVGRLTEQKGYENLLESFYYLKNLLEKENHNIPMLNIVGDGELKYVLINKCNELGIDENVNFLGVRKDINQLLMESDIYLMASKWEGLSISLIEASISGIPIVATNVGSNEEVVVNGKSGFLVESGENEKFAECIYRLIKEKNLREKFSIRLKDNIEKFNISETAQTYEELYKEVLKEN